MGWTVAGWTLGAACRSSRNWFQPTAASAGSGRVGAGGGRGGRDRPLGRAVVSPAGRVSASAVPDKSRYRDSDGTAVGIHCRHAAAEAHAWRAAAHPPPQSPPFAGATRRPEPQRRSSAPADTATSGTSASTSTHGCDEAIGSVQRGRTWAVPLARQTARRGRSVASAVRAPARRAPGRRRGRGAVDAFRGDPEPRPASAASASIAEASGAGRRPAARRAASAAARPRRRSGVERAQHRQEEQRRQSTRPTARRSGSRRSRGAARGRARRRSSASGQPVDAAVRRNTRGRSQPAQNASGALGATSTPRWPGSGPSPAGARTSRRWARTWRTAPRRTTSTTTPSRRAPEHGAAAFTAGR